MIKLSIVSLTALIGFSSAVYCQCPPGNTKVRTPLCKSPSSLRTVYVDCTTAKLEWKGQQNENYVVEIDGPDSSILKTIDVAATACDNFGNCSVTLPFNEGVKFGWRVQAACLLQDTGPTVYSYETNFAKATMPICDVADTSQAKRIALAQVFPNPASRYININYKQKATGPVGFSVFDVNGKIVLQKSTAESPGGTYRLDMNGFAAGIYTVKIKQGNTIAFAKVVLVKL